MRNSSPRPWDPNGTARRDGDLQEGRRLMYRISAPLSFSTGDSACRNETGRLSRPAWGVDELAMRQSVALGGRIGVRGLLLAIPPQTPPLHLVVERHPIDPQDARRLAHVAPGVGEHRGDVPPLDLLEG